MNLIIIIIITEFLCPIYDSNISSNGRIAVELQSNGNRTAAVAAILLTGAICTLLRLAARQDCSRWVSSIAHIVWRRNYQIMINKL